MADVPNVPGVPALNTYSTNNIELLTADAALVVNAFLPTWGIYYNGFPVIWPATVASSVIGSVLAPIGQVASLLGIPNLLPVFASTIEFDFDQEWTVADYPVEQGAFQSYDKVQLPFECRVRMACGGPTSQRTAFLNSIFSIAGGSPLGSTSLISSAISSLTGSVGSTSSIGTLGSSLTSGILGGILTPPLFTLVTPEGSYSSMSARRVQFSRKSYEGATLIVTDITIIQVRVTQPSALTNPLNPTNSSQLSGGLQQAGTPSTYIQNNFSSGNWTVQ